jgi:hypothetical protein
MMWQVHQALKAILLLAKEVARLADAYEETHK